MMKTICTFINENNATINATVQTIAKEGLGNLTAISVRDINSNLGILVYEKDITGNNIPEKALSVMSRFYSCGKPSFIPNNVEDIVSDFAQVAPRLRVKLINANWNQDILDNVIHEPIAGDLALIPYIEIGTTSDGIATAKATKQMCKSWKVLPEDVLFAAKTNTLKSDEIKFTSIYDQMIHMMIEDGMPEDFAKAICPPMDANTPMVLTNKTGMNGAVMILLAREVLDINKTYICQPSSIHEWLISEYENETQFKELNKMVSEVNEIQVAPEERLSDHAYIWKGGTLYRRNQ